MDGRVIADLLNALVPAGFVWDAMVPESESGMRSISEQAVVAGVPAGELLAGHEEDALYSITAEDAPVGYVFKMIGCESVLDALKEIDSAVKAAQKKKRDYDAGLQMLRESRTAKESIRETALARAAEMLEQAVNSYA